MSSNIIIFDADYVSELTSRMNIACQLMGEAVSSLKNAQNHNNWQCKERTRIIGDFDELNDKLGRLDRGVNNTTRILGGSISKYSSLESQYESQANSLSDELTSNFGFSATVRSEGSTSGGGSSFTENASGNSGAQAGAASAGAAGAASLRGSGARGRGSGASVNIGIRIPSGGRPGHNHAGPESGGSRIGGENTMNVNLPVTHIPDAPDAAANGIKDTQDIAHDVVNRVAHTMAQALTGQGTASTPQSAPHLAEAYNAGRRVFENSAAIMSSPTQPHTAERLAMAAGIVTLAGTAAGAGIATLGQAVASSGGGDFAQNAGHISAALQDNSDASEFRKVLGVFASSDGNSLQSSGILDLTGSGSSSGGNGSFFDMIIAELKKAFTGTQNGSSSSSIFSASSVSSSTGAASSFSETSPIMEFLGNFVMDQAV